jgi:hypothetical protein
MKPLSGRDVAYWPFCEVSAHLVEVRTAGYSGPDLLTLSSSHLTQSKHSLSTEMKRPHIDMSK